MKGAPSGRFILILQVGVRLRKSEKPVDDSFCMRSSDGARNS